MNKNINSQKIQLTEKDIIGFIFEKFLDVKKIKRILRASKFSNKKQIHAYGSQPRETKSPRKFGCQSQKKTILIEYESHLRTILKMKSTVNSHLNVIMHIFG